MFFETFLYFFQHFVNKIIRFYPTLSFNFFDNYENLKKVKNLSIFQLSFNEIFKTFFIYFDVSKSALADPEIIGASCWKVF